MKHHSSANQYFGTTFSECLSNFEGTSYNHEWFDYKIRHDGGSTNQRFNGIEKISAFALEGRASLFSLYIPQSVKRIGTAAFRACTDLRSVKFDSDIALERFEDSLFRDCISLNKIEIPRSVREIGDWTFAGCRNLNRIVLPEGVSDIGDFAFSGCCSLEEVVFPSSIRNIGHFAFSGCSSLKNIVFKGESVSMGEGVFTCCTSLQNIVLPEKQISISERLFSYCESLSKLELPKGIKEIGASAFRGCCSLMSISIPDNVTVLHSSLFRGCAGLKTINLPPALEEIESCAFYLCANLSQISFPETLNTIGENAFFKCISLERVSLPKVMGYIGNGAFALCKSLVQVKLPTAFEYENILLYPNGILDTDQSLPIFYGCDKCTFNGIRNKNTTDFFLGNRFGGHTFPDYKGKVISQTTSSVQDIVINQNSANAVFNENDIEHIVSGYTGNVALIVPGKNISVVFDGDEWYGQLARITKVIIREGVEEFVFTCAFYSSVQYYSFPKSIKRISMIGGVSRDDRVCVVLRGQDVEVEEGSFRFASELHLSQVSPVKNIHKWFLFAGGNDTGEVLDEDLAYMRQCTLYIPKGSKASYMQNPEYELFKAVIEE